jgi:glutathione S-transferase
MSILIGIDYSPWTRQARWALNHHNISYRFVNYIPMIGEPWLRWKLRRLRGEVSVPAFIDSDVRAFDSYAIALYAEQRSPATPPLFPSHLRDAVTDWNQAIDQLMQAGRALAVAAVAASPQAVRDSTPPAIPKALRGVSAPLTALGLRFIIDKYRANPSESHATTMRAVLASAQNTLSDGRPFLLGDTLTFADVNLWSALDFISPAASSPLRASLRPYWTRPALLQDFPNLFAWRDLFDAAQPEPSPAL